LNDDMTVARVGVSDADDAALKRSACCWIATSAKNVGKNAQRDASPKNDLKLLAAIGFCRPKEQKPPKSTGKTQTNEIQCHTKRLS
jgi:hypothetical protein